MQHEYCGQIGLFLHSIDCKASQYSLRKSNFSDGRVPLNANIGAILCIFFCVTWKVIQNGLVLLLEM